MPTLPSVRGSSGASPPARESWSVIVRVERQLYGCLSTLVGIVPIVTTGQKARLDFIDRAFRSLPERYLGAPEGFDATWHIVLGDVGRTWEVRCTTHGARVRCGATRRSPDVVIGTDATTWLALRQGELSGIEAFSERRLYARGNLD